MKRRDLFLTLGVFALLAGFPFDTACIDEFNYMAKSFSWGHLLNILKDEGKPPFPIWVVRPFVHTFGFELPVARLAANTFGALCVFVLILIFRRLKISSGLAVWTLLSSGFFIFYSRMFMYEIFLLFSFLLLTYGCLCLVQGDLKRGKWWIGSAVFIGLMTKRNFLLVLPFLPLLVIVFSAQKKRFDNFFAFIQASLIPVGISFFIVLFSGSLERVLAFSKYVATPENQGSRLNWGGIQSALEVLWINAGYGIILCLLGLSLEGVRQKKILQSIVLWALLVVPLLMTIEMSRTFMARYFIPSYGCLILVIVFYCHLLRPSFLKKISLFSLVFFQVVSFYRTAGPLLFHPQSLKSWTADEAHQHLYGYGPGFGYFGFERKIKELGKYHSIELQCKGDFAHTLCMYLPVFWPNLFQKGRDPLNLSFVKSTRPLRFSNSQVLHHVNQSFFFLEKEAHAYLVSPQKEE